MCSGSVVDCISRCPWFESYTDLTCISLGTVNKSSRLHSAKVWIGTHRGGVCACLIFLGSVCWLQTNRKWNSFPRWDPNDSFLVPREIHVRPVYDSNKDPSICRQANALPLDQRDPFQKTYLSQNPYGNLCFS